MGLVRESNDSIQLINTSMKGVFCIEGFWYGDHRDTTSVYPVLQLVRRYQNMPFLHHKCYTYEEFCFSIQRWKQRGFHKKYPCYTWLFMEKKAWFK